MLDVTKAHIVHDWAYDRPLLACRFDPQGRYVVTSAENNLLQKFSMADGKAEALPVVHDSWVQALAVSPDGNIAVSGGGDGRIAWWDMQSSPTVAIRTIEHAHDDYVRGLSISPDGKWLLSGGYDRAVKLWNLATGELVKSWNKHEMNVYSVQFLPDGARFISGDLKGVMYLWKIDADEPLAKFEGATLHSFNDGQRVNFGGIRSIATTADSSQIAASGLHKSTNPLGAVHEPLVLRFSLDAQALLRSHVTEGITGGSLWRCQYLAGDILCGVTGGTSGGFLLFWNKDQDMSIHKFALPSLARDMDVSKDGLHVATAHYDRHLRVTRLAE